jgi:hypothetical protein
MTGDEPTPATPVSESGDNQRPTMPSLEAVARAAVGVGRNLQKLGLRNITAIFAVTGFFIYLVGVARRIGQLKAEHISIGRGLPLEPLPDYFVQGLSVIVAVPTLLLLLGCALVVAAAYAWPTLFTSPRPGVRAMRRGPGPEPEPAKTSVGSHLRASATFLIPTVAVFWLVPLGALVTIIAGLFPALILLLVNSEYKFVEVAHWTHLTPVQARIFAAAFIISWASYFLAVAGFQPAPLDQAKITTVYGSIRSGHLLAQVNNFVYVVTPTRDREKESDIVAIPTNEIRRLEIEPGQPRYYQTLAELAGISSIRLGGPTVIEASHPEKSDSLFN